MADYKTHLQERPERYSDEAYFTQPLAADIDLAFVTLQSNQDLIASYQGMDDQWVKEAVRELRKEDKKLRNELTLLLNTIVSQFTGLK